MHRLLGGALAFGVVMLAGCTMVDRTSTGSVSMGTGHSRTNRDCYAQESLTQPRFGSCAGYHEKP
jgi:hypothetical protein